MRLYKLGVEKIDYIIANSERTKNTIKRVYNREAKVIYPCITQKNIMPINLSEHFIYVGRLEKPKNLENGIIAFKKLLENIEDKNLKFIIAGKGRHEKKLRNLSKKLE